MAYEKKLIEGPFPCQQVGAETKRERGASSMLPPIYYLHVWWARRPLTASRAAVLGSIMPADTSPDCFLRELGIVKKQVIVGNQVWTLVGKNLNLVEADDSGDFVGYSLDFQNALDVENSRREIVRAKLNLLISADSEYAESKSIHRWLSENDYIALPECTKGTKFTVCTVSADPAQINERIAVLSSSKAIAILGEEMKIDPEDLYAYSRAYQSPILTNYREVTVLDPTAGGGSIPFEAARLGCNVIANDLNPVASAIEIATVQYPAKYGKELIPLLEKYGRHLSQTVAEQTRDLYYFAKPDEAGRKSLLKQCGNSQSLYTKFDIPEYDQQGLLYCRTVTCPHCGERAPLLNAFALSKKNDGWMVIPEIVSIAGRKKVRFRPVQLINGKGPHGEDPERGTVKNGVGTCLHCGQAISSDEIKLQARGESQYGTWSDELFCIVAVREQPKLDKTGKVLRYTSGAQKGQIRTEKSIVFREPSDEDFNAVRRADQRLRENWDHWDEQNLIPTERFPEGNDMRPAIYGMTRWCDMFTSRQLVGLLTAMESLQNMTHEIIRDNGTEKGIAIVHYLQYMIDKCVDYNSRQNRWQYTKASISGTFGRHDFSLKWTFAEMVYTGPNTALAWGVGNVIKAYSELCELMPKRYGSVRILNGSAANLDLGDNVVDVICMDPPYYNNVQYAELSDFYYVWQKRTLGEFYPELFNRRLTNKADEAVANPVRDGNAQNANQVYEQRMSEIFGECRRVMKDDGLMVVMFTHKTQEAWETLTRALIENGWIISSSFPVDSEAESSMHQMDMAAAASSIFLACRKRELADREPALWSGFGGKGVAQQVREAVRQGLADYSVLHLNAVDEMVASYGCALRVLSENWPVIDGETLVSPITAMREASTVVAQHQMTRLTDGRLGVTDVEAEAGIALTLFGIYGTGWLPFDDALSLSKSLNIRLDNRSGGYKNDGHMIGINAESSLRSAREDEQEGFYAPLVSKGSKLRLALPEERNPRRLENPQSEWDVLHGLIMAYREGDMPVARAYLQKQAEGKEQKIIDILKVWADGCGSDTLQKEAERILFSLK